MLREDNAVLRLSMTLLLYPLGLCSLLSLVGVVAPCRWLSSGVVGVHVNICSQKTTWSAINSAHRPSARDDNKYVIL